jgi:predicted transcriptional regulator
LRFPIVATLVALSSVAGLAAAAAPLSFDVTHALPALPALPTAPAAPDLAGTVAPRVEAPLPAAGLAMAARPVAPEAPSAPVLPASADVPVLLLPDGFAFLAPGAPATAAGVRLGAAALPAAPRASAPDAPLAPSLLSNAEAQRLPPREAAPVAAAAPVPDAQTASSHVFVASPGTARVAQAAAAGALVALAGVGALALYHRIRPHAALENDTRKQIFDAVCGNPGLGVHAIASRAGVSYSTTTYHLERLVAAGMIVMTPDGNKLCYYKNGGAFTEAERRILPLVKNDEAAKLLEAILDSPGTYRAALAERLGVTATTINWHLRRLREAGLIDEVRQGRNAYLHVRLGTVRESFLSLAGKVDATDGAVAERLRRFAAFDLRPSGLSSGA